MFLRLENAERLARWTVEEIQRSIAKHKEFLDSLERDSDWAFTIKVHAFLEALVTSLIGTHSGNFSLGSSVSRLPMSSSEGLSKLELVKANKLMRPEQIGFIKKIGEIRNRLAHDVDMIEGFKFQDHIASLDKNQLGQWKLCLSRSLSTRDEGDAEDYFNLAESEPRYIISAGLLDVLCLIEGSKAEFLAHSKAEEVAKVDTLEILESYQAKSGLKSEEYSYTFSIELDDTI